MGLPDLAIEIIVVGATGSEVGASIQIWWNILLWHFVAKIKKYFVF